MLSPFGPWRTTPGQVMEDGAESVNGLGAVECFLPYSVIFPDGK